MKVLTMDFDSMKYSKLQKLAKKAGIKANMKVDKLVKALKEYYKDNGNDASSAGNTELGISHKSLSGSVPRGIQRMESEDPMSKDAESSTKAHENLPQDATSKSQGQKDIKSRSHTQQDIMPGLGTPPIMQGAVGQQKRHWRGMSQEGVLIVQVTPPISTSPSKQHRRSTFNVEKCTPGQCGSPKVECMADKQETSPQTLAVLNAISGDMSSEERRTKLMAAINRKVEQSMEGAPPASHIPRFAAFLTQGRPKKVVTPGNKDWEKIHKKAFAKFDSIDVYLEKRRKRTEDLSASVKKARGVLQEVQEAVTKFKSRKTSSVEKSDSQPFKPSILSTKDMNLNFAKTGSETASKRCSVAKVFKPTVISTKNMNLNFAALKSPGSISAVKNTPQLPARREMISCLQVTGTKLGARKSLNTPVKQAVDTSLHFTGNNTTTKSLNSTMLVKSASKIFDLQASLARPITWKPHTGKLLPLEAGYCRSGASASKSTQKPVGRHEELYKSHRTQRSNARRNAVAANRMKQKNIMLSKKRGVVPASTVGQRFDQRVAV